MALFSSALRRTLARTLSSHRHHFSLSRLITTPTTRNPEPGSTRTHFRFTCTESETVPASSLETSNTAKSNGGEDDDEGPPIWVNPETIDDDTVLVDGCDFNHWLIIMGFPEDPKPSDDEMIQSYVSTVAKAVGSEEEAKKKIYSVSTGLYTGFGVALSREVAKTLKGQPNVQWVLPDSYIDVPSKDFGGDLYLNGKVVHRPEFQVRMPQLQSDSESDTEPYDSPLVDFEYETDQFEESENNGIYKQLKTTMQAVRREPILSGIGGSDEASIEDTSTLLDRLSERMEVIRKKGKEGETKESPELNVKRIEPYESKNEQETCDSNPLLSEESGSESTTKNQSGMDKLRERLSSLRTQMKGNDKGLSGTEEEEKVIDGASALIGNTNEDTGLSGSDESKERESTNAQWSMDKLIEGLSDLKNEMKEKEKGKDFDSERGFGSESNHPIFDRIKERTQKRSPIEKYSFDDETEKRKSSSENARDSSKD